MNSASKSGLKRGIIGGVVASSVAFWFINYSGVITREGSPNSTVEFVYPLYLGLFIGALTALSRNAARLIFLGESEEFTSFRNNLPNEHARNAKFLYAHYKRQNKNKSTNNAWPNQVRRLANENIVPLAMLAALYLAVEIPEYTAHRARQEELERRNAVPEDAELTGTLWWVAYKTCLGIGQPNVANCATYSGDLPQEQQARAGAELAIDSRNEYYKSCQAIYSKDYCGNLLNRAVAIKRNQGALETRDN